MNVSSLNLLFILEFGDKNYISPVKQNNLMSFLNWSQFYTIKKSFFHLRTHEDIYFQFICNLIKIYNLTYARITVQSAFLFIVFSRDEFNSFWCQQFHFRWILCPNILLLWMTIHIDLDDWSWCILWWHQMFDQLVCHLSWVPMDQELQR